MSETGNKINWKLWAFLTILFLMLCYQTYDSFLYKGNGGSSVDTVIYLGKPVVNNYSITNPTLTKETTIIYDSTKKVLTKKDSDLIVLDYLKRRVYSDSVGSDTARIYYTAIVEKNSLKNIDITTKIKPKIIQITNVKYKRSLFLGLALAMINNSSLSVGGNISYAWQDYQVGTILDPLKKNYYFYMSKRINFDDKRRTK